MDLSLPFVGLNINGEDICLVDSATTHIILKNKKYFTNLKIIEATITTISGNIKIIEGSGRASILLPRWTKLTINDVLLSTKSKRNLLSFKDIRQNGYHVETMNENNIEYLYIASNVSGKKCVLEKLLAFSFGLYYTNISTIEVHDTMNQKFINS